MGFGQKLTPSDASALAPRVTITESDIAIIEANPAVAIKKDYTLNNGASIDSFNDLTGWTVTGGTIAANYKRVKTGASSLQISVSTAGGTAQARKDVNISLADTNKRVSLWVYLGEDIADISSITVYLYTVTPFVRYFYAHAYPAVLVKGWNLISISEGNWTASNGMLWSHPIQQIGINVVAAGGKTCSVIVNDVRVGKEWQPKIIFRFDDGLEGVYDNAYSIMSAKGINGTLYAISDNVDAVTAGYCTLAELTALYGAGWDIANHSKSHAAFNNLTFANTLIQVKNCQDWLIEKGFYRSARHFCVPNGQDTEFLQKALKDAGALTSTNSIHTQSPPEMNVYKIPAQAVLNTTPVSTITGWIDATVATGKTLVIMFHTIVAAAATEYEFSTENFQAVVDYLNTNDYLKYVVTMSEFYDGLNR